MKMTVEEGQPLWDAMYAKWQPLNQQARQAEMQNRIKFIDCAAGNGPGPTADELDQSDRLSREAEAVRIEMDELCRKVFGD